MTTLYDLLGALPKDDAEDLRAAFRKAAKGVHPDLHPGDPDAALKFRELVRASEILGDVEQRHVYDHLLDLAHQEQISAERATAARFHRFSSGVIAAVGVSIMTAGSCLLFMQMSAASLAPADKAEPSVLASIAFEPPPDTVPPLMKAEHSGLPPEIVDPTAILLKANAKANMGEIAATKQTERPDRAKPVSTSGAPRPGPASVSGPVTPPLPRPRPVTQDPSWGESVASMRPR